MNYGDENDWHLYRKLLPVWQGRYITKLNEEYIKLLSGPSSASDKFWALKKRIDKDSLSEGVIVEVSRSSMRYTIMMMLLNDIITPGDIEGFSDELKSSMKSVKEMRRKRRR